MQLSPIAKNMTVERACNVALTGDHRPTQSALIRALSMALVRLKHDRQVLGLAKGDPAKPATWPKGARKAQIFSAAANCAAMLKKVEGALKELASRRDPDVSLALWTSAVALLTHDEEAALALASLIRKEELH